jgi:hypothetical protein
MNVDYTLNVLHAWLKDMQLIFRYCTIVKAAKVARTPTLLGIFGALSSKRFQQTSQDQNEKKQIKKAGAGRR